jgi:hypothetical protein
MNKKTQQLRKRRRQLSYLRRSALYTPGPTGEARATVAAADRAIAEINGDPGVRQADAAEHRVKVLAAASALLAAAADPRTDPLAAELYALEARHALARITSDPEHHVHLAADALYKAADGMWSAPPKSKPRRSKVKSPKNRNLRAEAQLRSAGVPPHLAAAYADLSPETLLLLLSTEEGA